MYISWDVMVDRTSMAVVVATDDLEVCLDVEHGFLMVVAHPGYQPLLTQPRKKALLLKGQFTSALGALELNG